MRTKVIISMKSSLALIRKNQKGLEDLEPGTRNSKTNQGRTKPISLGGGGKKVGPPPLKIEQKAVNFQFPIYYHISRFSLKNETFH